MGVPYAEVIGDPIAHSKSPLIHKFWLEKLGIEGDYRADAGRPSELADYLGRRRADPGLARLQRHHAAQAGGRAAARRLDRHAAPARRGECDRAATPHGAADRHNTDVAGIAEPLAPGVDVSRASAACVIGTGRRGARGRLLAASRRRYALDHRSSRAIASKARRLAAIAWRT